MGITGTVPGGGASKLSQLEVDTHLNMQGYNIDNVGRVDQQQSALGSPQTGEAINAYDIVYLDGDLVKKADASNSNKMPAIGMAIQSGAPPATIDACFQGIITNAAWNFTSGAPLFVLSGGGMGHNIPDVSGFIVQSLGVALTKTTIHFQPEDTIMVIGE